MHSLEVNVLLERLFTLLARADCAGRADNALHQTPVFLVNLVGIALCLEVKRLPSDLLEVKLDMAGQR